jgi:hypothetical protein
MYTSKRICVFYRLTGLHFGQKEKLSLFDQSQTSYLKAYGLGICALLRQFIVASIASDSVGYGEVIIIMEITYLLTERRVFVDETS